MTTTTQSGIGTGDDAGAPWAQQISPWLAAGGWFVALDLNGEWITIELPPRLELPS